MTIVAEPTGQEASQSAPTGRLRATPLSPFLGAEISGLDLSEPVSEAERQAFLDLFYRHQVVAVRNGGMPPEQLVAFARLFGELEPFFISDYNLPGHPEIYVLSNVRKDGKPIGRDGAGTHWHSDSTFTERPSAVTILYAHETPDRGGDTLFADMHAAYERLAPEVRERIDGRRAIHRYKRKEHVYSADRSVSADERSEIERLKEMRREEERAAAPSPTQKKSNQVPDRLHPLVRTHPVTGRKALYMNDEMTVGIEGIPDPEGRDLLRHLCEHATLPEFVLRYRWRKGDVVAWDNASILHAATYTPPDEPRIMYRLTVEGTVPR